MNIDPPVVETIEKGFSVLAPWMVSLAAWEEVLTPIFPFCKIENKFAPVEEFTTKELDPLVPCTVKVDPIVLVPMPTLPVV